MRKKQKKRKENITGQKGSNDSKNQIAFWFGFNKLRAALDAFAQIFNLQAAENEE